MNDQMKIDFSSKDFAEKFFKPIKFDGSDIEPCDNTRLTGQILDIYNLMKDGNKRTLRGISDLTGYGESSISAQLRNLRKDRFGSHQIEKERTTANGGTWVYWIVK